MQLLWIIPSLATKLYQQTQNSLSDPVLRVDIKKNIYNVISLCQLICRGGFKDRHLKITFLENAPKRVEVDK